MASSDADIAAVFMVEPGHYEWPAILLAASLRAFATDRISIHAYCRASLIDQLHADTVTWFERHGIELAAIEPEFEVIYPQGNKLYACAAKRQAPATILFDTDILLLRPIRLAETLVEGCISGRPTGPWMWGKTAEEWRPAYESVGLDLPRLRLGRPNGSFTAPSINAGYVGYTEQGFGEVWRDTALEIERKRLAKGIYPTLDQISLAVATERAGLLFNFIEATWNMSGEINRQAVQKLNIYHYQKAERLLDLPVKWLADALLQDSTDFASLEDLIAFYDREAARPVEVLHNEGYWKAVIRKQRKVDEPHKP
ncbi:hypothetical protein AAD018_014230 [Aestuariibius insulae]|uniref:hypothetical protein n=1 Tax=Aestuariibius insulae TaxID=2058287 RepID=UPI00345E9936